MLGAADYAATVISSLCSSCQRAVLDHIRDEGFQLALENDNRDRPTEQRPTTLAVYGTTISLPQLSCLCRVLTRFTRRTS